MYEIIQYSQQLPHILKPAETLEELNTLVDKPEMVCVRGQASLVDFFYILGLDHIFKYSMKYIFSF